MEITLCVSLFKAPNSYLRERLYTDTFLEFDLEHFYINFVIAIIFIITLIMIQSYTFVLLYHFLLNNLNVREYIIINIK